MDAGQAIQFVEIHGIVTESARAIVPSLAEEVAGEPISGSWWAHPKHRLIFKMTRVIRGSHEVLVCRLVQGKVTYIHQRLWPALVRLADEFDQDRLASIQEIHTPPGKHITRETPYPDWVPPETMSLADQLAPSEAIELLGEEVFARSRKGK